MKSSDLMRMPGRPKTISGEGSRVSAWIPANLHDALAMAAAADAHLSVSALIRQALERQFPPKK